MWEVNQFVKTGNRNLDMGLACQDCVAYSEHEDCQAIALADGAGDTDFARIGAERAGETVTQLLTEKFDALYAMEEKLIQFQVIANVKSRLYELCEQYELSLEKLQSTLLGVAVNHKTKQFLAVHLGDGRIQVCKNGIFRTLSYPENSINKCYTKLTSGNHSGKSIRIYRGAIEEIEQFCLSSDGWEEGAQTVNGFLEEERKAYHYNDDVSFIALSRTES